MFLNDLAIGNSSAREECSLDSRLYTSEMYTYGIWIRSSRSGSVNQNLVHFAFTFIETLRDRVSRFGSFLF